MRISTGSPDRTFDKYHISIFFLLFSALAASFAHATDYHVGPSTTGNGSGSDWSNQMAWSSFTPARGTGNIYYIRGGSYAGKTFTTAVSGTTVITIKKATVAEHGSDTGWVSTYGTDQAQFSSNIRFESSYWVFDGVTGGGPGSWRSGYGFKITEGTGGTANFTVVNWGSNVVVQHVEMQGPGVESYNDGIVVQEAGTNFRAAYIWFHGIGRCPIQRGVTGGTALFEYLFVDSYFARSSIHGEIIAPLGDQGNTTIRYSLITDMQSTGGIMWDNRSSGSHLYIYGNVFYKPAGKNWSGGNGTIGGWTGGGNEFFSNVHVYNNTWINANIPILHNYFQSAAYNGNNEFYNNLLYNSTSPSFNNTYQDSGQIWQHNYNHYINSGGTHSEANGTSATSGDPFIDYVNLNFGLKAPTSAGTALGFPYNVDMLGKIRGMDGKWDRGAYEFIVDGISVMPMPPEIISVQ